MLCSLNTLTPMIRRSLWGLTLALLMGSATQAKACDWTGEGTWARYQPGTLREVEREFTPSKPGGVGTTATGLPIKVTVIYGGQSRSMSEANRDAIANFAGPKQNIIDLFTQEFLFIENGVEYWLPLQKQMIPFVDQELAKGDRVQLLTLWVGYSHPQDKIHHTFVVNEFCKP